MSFSDRVGLMLPTRLRSNYLCGSLFQPLKGEPFDRWQRMLVVLCTILCTLMVNVGFFQSKHDQLEMCEGPLTDGRPTNCTGDVQEQALCYCQTFDCGAQGCNSCEHCDTIDICAESCPVVKSSRIIQTFVTVLITWPIGSLLQKLFEWLHRPYVQMVEKELRLASEADALARVKRGVTKDGHRRYGRASGAKQKQGVSSSDLEGDEGSKLGHLCKAYYRVRAVMSESPAHIDLSFSDLRKDPALLVPGRGKRVRIGGACVLLGTRPRAGDTCSSNS